MRSGSLKEILKFTHVAVVVVVVAVVAVRVVKSTCRRVVCRSKDLSDAEGRIRMIRMTRMRVERQAEMVWTCLEQEGGVSVGGAAGC